MTPQELIQRVVATAAGEVGVKESPAGSNNVKYNTDYYGQAVHDGLWNTKFPWCCVFVWWVFKTAGLPGIFYAGGKTASCTTLWSWFKGFDRIVPFDQAQPGDIVFFRWTSGQKTPQHVGIVESRSGDTLTTIEGNTAVGNDGNGGAVMRRTRKADVVFAVARPLYQVEEERTMNKCTVKIKLADIERVAIVFGNGRSLAQVKAAEGCDYVINGGLYDSTGPVCHLKVDGVVKAKDQWGYIGYGWDQGPDIRELAVPEEGGQARNYIACVQLLGRGMKQGDKPIYGTALGGKRGRTAMALTQDSLILYCTKDGSSYAATPETLQTEMDQMGATSALMLDSGGSSQCDFGGGQTVTSSRKVNNYICVWLKKTPIGRYKVATNGGTLTIRAGTGSGTAALGAYANGTVVDVYETKDGWARTAKGWCSMDWLREVPETPAAPATTETPSAPADTAKTSWDKAKAAGILDGTAPTDLVTEEKLAVVLDRLGLL